MLMRHLVMVGCLSPFYGLAQEISINSGVNGGTKIIQIRTGDSNEQSINISNQNVTIKNNDTTLEIDAGDVNDSSGLTVTQCDFTKPVKSATCNNRQFGKATTRIKVGDSDMLSSRFHNTHLEHSTFDSVDLSEASFLNAKIISSTFSQVDLADARFNNVKMYNAKFMNTDLSDTEMTNIDFQKATFINVDFDGAVLTNVSFKDTNILPGMLSDAELHNVTFPNGVVCLSNDACEDILN